MAAEPPVFSKLLQPKKRRFLAALVLAGGNYTRAAQVCKIDRNYHYYWKASDELYRAEHERAIELATDRLEDEMLRRAYQGVKRPIMHAGKQAQVFAVDEDGNPIKDESGKYRSVPAVLTEYDTTLMIFALKARRPEKYRERTEQKITGTVQHSGAVDVRAAVMAVIQKLPEDTRALVARELLQLEKAG